MSDGDHLEPDALPECIVCKHNAVTIDRNGSPMCAKHAAMFVTMDHRKNIADKARIVK